jgi:sulfofructose kinase
MGGNMQIVGVGLTTIDILVRLGEMPTWEEGRSLHELRMDGGGPVGTGMVAAARLGAGVGFIGTCGSDETAQFKMSFLTRYGVDVSRVVCRPGPEEHIVLCYVHDTTGERVFSMKEDLRGDELRPDELDRAYITSADYLELDGFHFEAALQSARWMHAAGKKVMLDAGKSSGTIGEPMRALVHETDLA